MENWRAEHGVNASLVLWVCMHGLVKVHLVVSLDKVRNEEVAFLDIVGCCEMWFVRQGRRNAFGVRVGRGQYNKRKDAMSLRLLGLLSAHILRICHGNKTGSMMHLHNARERLSGIADLCQVLDAGNT